VAILNRRRRLSSIQFRSVLPVNGRISVLGLVASALLACDGSIQSVSLTALNFGICSRNKMEKGLQQENYVKS
jgi:hypothetical protein